MQRIIFTIAMIAAGSAAAAEPTKDELCAGWGRLAGKIMELRQDEAPMSDVMKIATSGGNADVERAMILEAYKDPAYGSDAAKRKAAEAFRNRIELECYRNAK